MLYLGLDLLSKHIQFCVLDERGNRLVRTELATVENLSKVLGRLEDRFFVCFEASCGYGWYVDLLAAFRKCSAERPKSAAIV